jgi:hypothetical protein
LSATAQIKGEGMAPDINKVLVDFGRKKLERKILFAMLKNSVTLRLQFLCKTLDGNLDDGNFDLIVILMVFHGD